MKGCHIKILQLQEKEYKNRKKNINVENQTIFHEISYNKSFEFSKTKLPIFVASHIVPTEMRIRCSFPCLTPMGLLILHHKFPIFIMYLS